MADSSHSEPTPRRRKPAIKQLAIADDLRTRIVGGAFPPSSRLPTRVNLESEYNASTITVQRALDDLADDGFIEARGSLGTFVSATPPHLCNYGLVFQPALRDRRNWSKFWSALETAAEELSESELLNIFILYGAEGRIDAPEHQHLLEMVRRRRVAGLIYSSNPQRLQEQVAQLNPAIPQVYIGGLPVAGLSSVKLDHEATLDMTLEYLKARGGRRVGSFFVALADEAPLYMERFRAAAARFGMQTERIWNQQGNFPFVEAVRNCAELMGNLPVDRRPDSLFIADDNLEGEVIAGLLAAGLQIGRDIEIVSHCNFPAPSKPIAPIRRIGFDAREILAGAMKLIDGQFQSKRLPDVVVRPRFETARHSQRAGARHTAD